MSDVRRFSATYASDRGWVIGRVPLMMGNTQFVLASDYDKQEAEIARCQEIAERDGRDYADLKAELAEALVLLAASHESTAEVARDTKYRHMDDCSICAFLDRQGAKHE